MAAAPPAVAAAHARLLDASAKVIVGRKLPGDIDTHFMLKALARLHPFMQDAGPLARFLVYELPLYEEYNSLTSEQVCAAVEVVGELLLNAPTVRRVLMPTAGHVSGVVGILVYEGKSEMERMLWWSADADAAGDWWPEGSEPYLGTPNLLRLLRGFAMISEACSASSISSSSMCSTSSSCSSTSHDGGGDSDGVHGSDSDLFGIDPAPDVALQAAAAAQDIASALEGQAFRLSPQELSSLAVSLARLRYGTDRCYRTLVGAATSRSTFRSAATPADWAQLWHALALVRHRPDDALIRCTAAALTKQQQYGSATAADCATLLLSLAELRCYDGGLVEGLVQLVVAGGGGVEVRDLTNAVWAVAVMGPEALQSHCGAVGQLLREVVAAWEQGGVGVGAGNQEQLWQLWQMQLELEGLVDGVAGSSGGSSSSSPGQLRHILPPDLLRAAEEAAGEGSGGVHNGSMLLQRLREEVCLVLQGMVQQGGEQQAGQGAQGQRRAGGKKTNGSEATAVEDGSAVADGAAGAVPACAILSVTPEAAVPELRCTADVVVELGGGRRVAVDVEGPGRLLTNHPHTETRTGPAELRRRQLERVLGSGNVVGVSYWAWEELGGDRGRQEAWLGGRLAEVPGAGDEESGGEAKGWRTRKRQARERQGEKGLEEQQGAEKKGREEA